MATQQWVAISRLTASAKRLAPNIQ
jgi:hypothetical protein